MSWPERKPEGKRSGDKKKKIRKACASVSPKEGEAANDNFGGAMINSDINNECASETRTTTRKKKGRSLTAVSMTCWTKKKVVGRQTA